MNYRHLNFSKQKINQPLQSTPLHFFFRFDYYSLMSVMGVQKCCPCARMNYIINKPIIIIYIFNQGRMTEMMAIEDSDFSTITHLGVEDGLNDNLFSLPIKISLIVLAVISSVISLLIPALYFAKRKCREHPSSLIAIISLLEALSNYNVILIAVNIYLFEQFVQIKYIYDILVFGKTRQPSETQFCEINFTIYILLQLMSIAYNISFSADLLVTLKKPFFAGKKRMKFYHIFCLLFVTCGLPMSIVEAEDICKNQFHAKSIYRIPFAFFVALSLFYVISFIIIVMSFRSVQTSQIRIKYIRLHRIILFTLIFLWAFPMATNIMIILGDEQSTVFHIFNLASFISLLVSGGMINIVRFYNDPYVWLQIKKMITQCNFRQKKRETEDEEKKNNQEGDIWNLPLAHAVSTYHHQSVISNIIQIVLETCVNAPQEIAIQKSDYHHQPQHYYFNSTILSLRDIKKMLKNGSKQDTKKLAKITKTLQMVCLQRKDSSRKDTQKNIYKAVDFIASYSSEKDTPALNQSDQCSQGSQGNKEQTVLTSKQINARLKTDDKAITIKVKSYADPVFLALRLIDNFSSDELNNTLNLALNSENIKKARQSLGASGSFFFFSFDHKLVIKTISEKECHIFLKILPQYYEHILKYPNSLISRTYGLFSVEIAGISKIYFIMMENTLRNFQQNDVVYKKYDLKGSTIKREVKNINADVFKDINLLKSDDAFLMMTAQRKKHFLQQIKADITLFSQQNIMDYSLLLGIGFYKKISKENHRILQQEDLQHSQNQWRCFDDGHQITGKMYSISLIDYLQQFDIHKNMELKLKKIFKGGGDISSVDTATYYQRFFNFVTRIIVVVKA